jgi:hypothetical protein
LPATIGFPDRLAEHRTRKHGPGRRNLLQF